MFPIRKKYKSVCAITAVTSVLVLLMVLLLLLLLLIRHNHPRRVARRCGAGHWPSSQNTGPHVANVP